MIGLALIDSNNVLAINGKIIDGPRSDKAWLLEQIEGKTVLVGARTFEQDLIHYKNFMRAIKQVVVFGRNYCSVEEVMAKLPDIDYSLGGGETFDRFPPEKYVIHQLHNAIDTYGCSVVSLSLHENYVIGFCKKGPEYDELLYVRKNNGE